MSSGSHPERNLPITKDDCLGECIILPYVNPALTCSNRQTIVRCDANFKEGALIESVDFGFPFTNGLGEIAGGKEVHC